MRFSKNNCFVCNHQFSTLYEYGFNLTSTYEEIEIFLYMHPLTLTFKFNIPYELAKKSLFFVDWMADINDVVFYAEDVETGKRTVIPLTTDEKHFIIARLYEKCYSETGISPLEFAELRGKNIVKKVEHTLSESKFRIEYVSDVSLGVFNSYLIKKSKKNNKKFLKDFLKEQNAAKGVYGVYVTERIGETYSTRFETVKFGY